MTLLPIPRAPERPASASPARYRRLTLWRPGREEREGGLSSSSAKVCAKNITQEQIAPNNLEIKKGSLAAGQAHDAFNVECLRKEIDHVNFFHVVASFQKQAGIARKGGWIAGNVDNPLHPQGGQQLRCLSA